MVSTTTSRSHLLSTSFLNEYGSLVTIIMNQSDIEIEYKLYCESEAVQLTIPPDAIQTQVIR
ncbi:MAG: glycoside hydrolase family 30 beta sandwich domain-containing protein [Saprospiraceae bacterium]